VPYTVWAQPQEPGNQEQLLIYELNRARNNPARFDQENNLVADLSGVASQPPLAVNQVHTFCEKWPKTFRRLFNSGLE
jgi:hypothetical protein